MLKALMDFPYAGKAIRRGEYFTAVCDSDRALLVLGARAEEQPEQSVEVVPVPTPESDSDEQKPKSSAARRYTRRDMRVES